MTKILIILISTFGLYSSAKADTIDYWHVYYNDKVIAKFNSVSKDLNIKIKKSEIKETDTISIRYGKDTRCSCKYILCVLDEKKRQLRITESDEFWGKLSFGLSDLTKIGQKNGSQRYDFYYWERIVMEKIDR